MTAFRKLINEVKQSYSRIFIDTKGDLADEALQLIPKADAAILPSLDAVRGGFYRTIEKIVEQNDASTSRRRDRVRAQQGPGKTDSRSIESVKSTHVHKIREMGVENVTALAACAWRST